jgi:DNA-binding CsgD family transcriptional regulator
VLHGRATESARLRELVADAAASRGGALVVRGEPGSGKTALLSDAAGHAEGTRVLWTQGLESESPLPFAALGRLLRPVLGHLDRIPPGQALALRRALGEVATGEGPDDRYLVFVASLSLLAEAAEEQPVWCIADDAHWLDPASADALMFVARRIGSDRVALAFGAREGDVRRFDGAGLPELLLPGLDPASALALLTERAGVPVSDAVRDQLVERTGGNPLALVELPQVLTDGQLTGRIQLPAALPLTRGVERAFLDRSRRLPEDAQTWLLVAAADDSGRLATVAQAAELLGAGGAALDAAERSGLVAVSDGAVVLRHPLVRSAVYAGSTTSARQAAHRALAEVLRASGDADRRTWHRALATTGFDDDIACALDEVAERAGRRGGHEAASSAAERAAELTADPDVRARRWLAAASSAWRAGDGVRTQTLADEGRRTAQDPVLRADLDRLRGRVEWNIGSPQTGYAIVMAAAREVAPTDGVRALELAMLGTTLATFGADAHGPSPGDDLTYLAALPPTAPARLRCLMALVTGHRHVLRGERAAAAEALHQALQIADELPPSVDILANVGIAALHLGDDERVSRTFGQLLALGRSTGDVATVIIALVRLPCGQLPAGDWRGASASADEALLLARGVGQPGVTALPLAWLAVLAAGRGHAGATEILAEVEQVRRDHPLGIVTQAVDDVVSWARGLLAANARDDGRALHHLSQIRHPALARLAATDRVEGAVRALRLDLAADWVADLDRFGRDAGAGWALAVAEHGRALLDDGDRAVAHFDRALTLHQGACRTVDRARTELAFGEFLRRSGRRVDAREHLRRAIEVFDDVGAQPWAERARHELRAAGETARKRDVTTTEDLTPQERQTALLVGQGLSNREVAARLFLSPRTIEYHLSHVYQKLGVRSRSELARLTLD